MSNNRKGNWSRNQDQQDDMSNDPPISNNKRFPTHAKPSGRGQNFSKPSANKKVVGFRTAVGSGKKSLAELMSVKPSALSTSSSDRNDPLIREGFLLEGNVALTPSDKLPTFELDYSQFIVLAKTSYNSICRVDRGFGKYVSEAMYVYYAVIILWRRLYHVTSESGQNTVTASEFDAIFQYCKVQIPKDLHVYLSGIGNITDATGRKAELKIQARCQPTKYMGATGHYGKVDVETHILYETLPSPFVALSRINQDLRATTTNQVIENWDLISGLAPSVEGSTPNVNLLGYDRARPMTPEQVRELQGGGFIVDESFGTIRNIDNIPIQTHILSVVSECLAKAKAPVSTPEAGQYDGSVAQVMVTEPAPEDIDYERWSIISSRMGSSKNFAQVNANIASGGIAFRYRLKRSLGSTDYHGLCYAIVVDKEPSAPSGWIHNQNVIYDAVPPIWNVNRYTTANGLGSDAAQAVSNSCLNR